MFLITSASRYDSLWAIPLLAGTVTCYGFHVLVVRADAAYITIPIMCFIRYVLGDSFFITTTCAAREGKRLRLGSLSISGTFTNAFAPSLNATSSVGPASGLVTFFRNRVVTRLRLAPLKRNQEFAWLRSNVTGS
jgi:hypothetical protein